MTKQLMEKQDYMFDVEKKVVKGQHDRFNVLRKDTGKVVGRMVSDCYVPVSNKQLLDPMFKRYGSEALQSATRTWAGVYGFVVNTHRAIKVDGDKLEQQIIVLNSFNRQRAIRIVAGAFRFACSNGLYIGKGQVLELSRVHVGDGNLTTSIHKVLNAADKADYSLWNRMAAKKISEDDRRQFIQTVDLGHGSVGGTSIERAIRWTAMYDTNQPKERTTVFGLYNSINWSIARVVPAREVGTCIALNNALTEAATKYFSIN